jgi:hypothetical protein
MENAQPTRAERQYARVLLTIRSGRATRRADRIKAVSGMLALGSVMAFVGFATTGRLAALAFVCGVVGGIAGSFWLLSRHARARHQVALQAFDWSRVEQLASEPGQEGGGHAVP